MYKDIKNYSKTKGFELCGITRAEYGGGYEHVEEWIRKRYNAGMEWMSRNEKIRQDPSLLLENAKTVVIVGKYYDDREYDLGFPRIARYAQRIDYHISLKNGLKEILRMLEERYGVAGRVFVDSAPVMERYWAQRSGLGWIGRNGSLINREYGAFLLLGGLIIDAECDNYDTPDDFNGCGSCSRCIEKCPTGALMESGTVDCNCCLSYLTIEHRGEFSDSDKKLVRDNGWIYGCDVCTEICPWSIKAAKKYDITDFTGAPYTRENFMHIPEYTNSEFKRVFGCTPLFHSGKKNITRNIEVFNEDIISD